MSACWASVAASSLSQKRDVTVTQRLKVKKVAPHDWAWKWKPEIKLSSEVEPNCVMNMYFLLDGSVTLSRADGCITHFNSPFKAAAALTRIINHHETLSSPSTRQTPELTSFMCIYFMSSVMQKLWTAARLQRRRGCGVIRKARVGGPVLGVPDPRRSLWRRRRRHFSATINRVCSSWGFKVGPTVVFLYFSAAFCLLQTQTEKV